MAIVAPFYYRLSSEGVYAYFREIARAVRVDVTLYNIPMFASPIESDAEVNRARFDLDNACLNLLAMQAPMANDLREVIAALKIASALERLLAELEEVLTR